MTLMKKAVVLLAAAAFAVLPAKAQSARDVDIKVSLNDDGSAQVVEVWDITSSRGTEIYLGRENLGDIEIRDLAVSDETGLEYLNEGRWNVDRSLEQKRGRCGLNPASGGYEICWGIGSYGNHQFKVSYTLTNLVKSLNDYDMLHFQFVTPSDFCPDHVRLTLDKSGVALDSLNSRIWAFGYYGSIVFDPNGTVRAESTEGFMSNSSLILLVRFDKGIMTPTSIQNKDFDDVYQKAMKGVDKNKDEMSPFEDFLYTVIGILMFLGMCALPFIPVIASIVSKSNARKKALGNNVKIKDVPWSREVPYDGSVFAGHYVLQYSLQQVKVKNCISSAIIMRMVQNGIILTQRDAKGKMLLSFAHDPDMSNCKACEIELYEMMKEASGSNLILEDREFSKWAAKHKSKLIKWTDKVKNEGFKALTSHQWYANGSYTQSGQAENIKMLGFKKFLEDFTLIKDRATNEAVLWRDYLTFAALLGIADKVAKELKDIDPVMFEKACNMSYNDMTNVILFSNSYNSAILNNAFQPQTTHTGGGSFSSGGFGGGSSFGGGGGFSGGGHSGVR